MEADTKTVPFLYRSPLPGTAGIDRYKMVLIQYRICTVMFTGIIMSVPENVWDECYCTCFRYLHQCYWGY